MRDSKSLLLLLLSIGMVSTWIYHLYDKNHYASQVKEVVVHDTSGIAQMIRDSMQRVYASSVNEMGETVDTSHASADSLRGQLDTRLTEIKRLRNEISQILSNKNISKSELRDARDKIRDLHSKVDEMSVQNLSLEDERKKLNGELGQLTEEVKGLQVNISSLDSQNRQLKEIVHSASTLSTTDLTLSVIDSVASRGAEMETTKAKRANKMVVSFIAQNGFVPFSNTEIFVVVTAPDGSVITNAIWESANFDTNNEKGKPFTRKIRFDYAKGEQKRLIFSLEYDRFTKGTYTLQLYHNGSLIGATEKRLS